MSKRDQVLMFLLVSLIAVSKTDSQCVSQDVCSFDQNFCQYKDGSNGYNTNSWLRVSSYRSFPRTTGPFLLVNHGTEDRSGRTTVDLTSPPVCTDGPIYVTFNYVIPKFSVNLHVVRQCEGKDFGQAEVFSVVNPKWQTASVIFLPCAASHTQVVFRGPVSPSRSLAVDNINITHCSSPTTSTTTPSTIPTTVITPSNTHQCLTTKSCDFDTNECHYSNGNTGYNTNSWIRVSSQYLFPRQPGHFLLPSHGSRDYTGKSTVDLTSAPICSDGLICVTFNYLIPKYNSVSLKVLTQCGGYDWGQTVIFRGVNARWQTANVTFTPCPGQDTKVVFRGPVFPSRSLAVDNVEIKHCPLQVTSTTVRTTMSSTTPTTASKTTATSSTTTPTPTTTMTTDSTHKTTFSTTPTPTTWKATSTPTIPSSTTTPTTATPTTTTTTPTTTTTTTPTTTTPTNITTPTTTTTTTPTTPTTATTIHTTATRRPTTTTIPFTVTTTPTTTTTPSTTTTTPATTTTTTTSTNTSTRTPSTASSITAATTATSTATTPPPSTTNIYTTAASTVTPTTPTTTITTDTTVTLRATTPTSPTLPTVTKTTASTTTTSTTVNSSATTPTSPTVPTVTKTSSSTTSNNTTTATSDPTAEGCRHQARCDFGHGRCAWAIPHPVPGFAMTHWEPVSSATRIPRNVQGNGGFAVLQIGFNDRNRSADMTSEAVCADTAVRVTFRYVLADPHSHLHVMTWCLGRRWGRPVFLNQEKTTWTAASLTLPACPHSTTKIVFRGVLPYYIGSTVAITDITVTAVA